MGDASVKAILTKFSNFVHLTNEINQLKSGIDCYHSFSSGEGVKFALSHRNNNWSLPHAALPGLQVMSVMNCIVDNTISSIHIQVFIPHLNDNGDDRLLAHAEQDI